MNCNLESGRVLAAVDDTYAELLLLSRLAGGSGGDGTEIASDELDAHFRRKRLDAEPPAHIKVRLPTLVDRVGPPVEPPALRGRHVPAPG